MSNKYHVASHIASSVPRHSGEEHNSPILNVQNPARQEWAGKAPNAPLWSAVVKNNNRGHFTAPELQSRALQDISNGAANSQALPAVPDSAAPPGAVSPTSSPASKKNKKKKSPKKKHAKNSSTANSFAYAQTDIALYNKTISVNPEEGLGMPRETVTQGTTSQTGPSVNIGEILFPDLVDNSKSGTLLERLTGAVVLQPGTFLRPKPRHYGVQCPRTLGRRGVQGCRYGPNCYYGHEGDVYPGFLHKSAHYVDRWNTELTDVEKRLMKGTMEWSKKFVRKKGFSVPSSSPHSSREHSIQGPRPFSMLTQPPAFMAEPRLRAINVRQQQQVQTRPRDQSQGLQSNGQASSHLQQYQDLAFHNQMVYSPPISVFHPSEGSPRPLNSAFPQNLPSCSPRGFNFQPIGHPITPAAGSPPQFPVQHLPGQIPGHPLVYRKDSVGSYHSHYSYQAQPPLPQFYYPQPQYYGDNFNPPPTFYATPYVMQQPFQGCIAYGGMNTRNMEQIPQISSEDLVHSWRQDISDAFGESGPKSPSTGDDVKSVTSFKFSPTAPEFVPTPVKKWPGLKEGQVPSHPHDINGTVIASVTTPGLLVYTAAGPGYYGNNGTWYPYREPSDDGKDSQKAKSTKSQTGPNEA